MGMAKPGPAPGPLRNSSDPSGAGEEKLWTYPQEPSISQPVVRVPQPMWAGESPTTPRNTLEQAGQSTTQTPAPFRKALPGLDTRMVLRGFQEFLRSHLSQRGHDG